MKAVLDEAGIKKHLITQPVGFKTPESFRGNVKLGFTRLLEFPFGKFWTALGNINIFSVLQLEIYG
jgi:hypothetical protein